MKILFVASEAMPFIRTGGLGDVAGALPKSFLRLGHDARVIIPFYKDEIKSTYRDTLRFVGATEVELGWRRQYCGVYEAVYEGITYYFVDNEYYFKRKGLYGHFDDGERFAFFSKAVLDVLKMVDFYPDVLHTNDWHTALTPVYLDVYYRGDERYKGIKTVYTIHNIEFQGKFDQSIFDDILGLPESAKNLVIYDGCVNYMKGGIECSAVVTTVSDTYATEILDPFYSYGLESILEERKYKIHGVVNGIDTKLYDPSKDKALFVNYNKENVADKKKENKKALCEMLNLSYDENRPLIAMVTRLTEQKGLDLVGAVIGEILRADLQVVILGTGEWKYENVVLQLEDEYPHKFRGILQFSSDLASKLYGASDLFLMPSKFEPCGLSQLIAMRYGSVPIVRETGGLKDSIINFEKNTGNGYTFKGTNAWDMYDVIKKALDDYQNEELWKKQVTKVMNKDFGWSTSAKEYIKMYEEILEK